MEAAHIRVALPIQEGEMKPWLFVCIVIGMFCLSGCNQPEPESPSAPHHGRYIGVGTYAAGEMWAKIRSTGTATAATAKTTDDEHVIVVVDSKTGEIRECGDLTGFCIGMNPWAKAMLTGQTAPVALNEHASAKPSDEGAAASK
jgi:hypothetical protein